MAHKKTLKADGWSNVLTRLGTGYDKRTSHEFAAKTLTYEQSEALWRGSDLGARIVERPVDEMIRQGWDVVIPNDKERQDTLSAQLEDLEVPERLREALYYARAYGGGAVLVGADDGATDLKQPLGTVRSILYLTALTSRELRAVDYYTDPREERYGQPKTYQLTGDGINTMTVHESRVLIFPGNVTSRTMLKQNQGWGDSIFVRVGDVLRDFDIVWDSAAYLMNDFAQAVFKIKGLAEIIASTDPDAANAIRKRMQTIEMSRSVIRGVLIDSEEGFERQQTPIAGLPEILEKFMFRLAAASEMPVSMLFGQAPAGLNATGDADIRFYYDHLKNRQDRTLRPPLERLVSMVFQANGGEEPEQWSVQFRPLWQLTEPEKANCHIAQANADQVYLNGGVLSAKEIRASRFGEHYSVETILIPGEEPQPVTTTGQPSETPTPPNGESPDGTKPLEAVQGAGGRQAVGGAVAPPVASGPDIQKTALSGIQVTSMLEVLASVAEKKLPRESALMVLEVAFQLERRTAELLLGSIGKSFFAEEPQVTPPPKAAQGAGTLPPR